MTQREPDANVADLKLAIAQLWKNVEALKVKSEAQTEQTHRKLDEWIATNCHLLTVIQNNSEQIESSAKNYAESMKSLGELKRQLNDSDASMGKLVNSLSSLENFHLTIQESNQSARTTNANLQTVNDKLVKLNRRTLSASQKWGINVVLLFTIVTLVLGSAIGGLWMLHDSNNRVNLVLEKVQRIDKVLKSLQ